MNKSEKQVRDVVYKILKIEFDKLEKCKNKNEKIDKLQMLYRINKYLENYDELIPILDDYFENKRNKERFER